MAMALDNDCVADSNEGNHIARAGCGGSTHTPSDATINALKGEIIRLQNMVADMQMHQNSVTVIGKMPHELLVEILHHTAGPLDDWRTPSEWPIPLTSVCRKWRAAALDCDTLWSTLDTRGWKHFETQLQRARHAPLRLTLNDGLIVGGIGGFVNLQKDVMETRLTHILPVLDRVQACRFDFHDSHVYEPLFQVLDRSALALATLQVLSGSCRNNDWPFRSALFKGETPMLHSLRFDNVRGVWQSPLLLGAGATITEFTYIAQGWADGNIVNRMYDSFKEMPCLERLHIISEPLCDSLMELNHQRPLSMKYMKSLILEGSAGGGYILLQMLEIPSDASLSFDLGWCGSSGRPEALFPFAGLLSTRMKSSISFDLCKSVNRCGWEMKVLDGDGVCLAWREDFGEDHTHYPGLKILLRLLNPSSLIINFNEEGPFDLPTWTRWLAFIHALARPLDPDLKEDAMGETWDGHPMFNNASQEVEIALHTASLMKTVRLCQTARIRLTSMLGTVDGSLVREIRASLDRLCEVTNGTATVAFEHVASKQELMAWKEALPYFAYSRDEDQLPDAEDIGTLGDLDEESMSDSGSAETAASDDITDVEVGGDQAGLPRMYVNGSEWTESDGESWTGSWDGEHD